MTEYYLYKRGGWNIAVDAVSQHDAAQVIRRNAPGAEFCGRSRCEGNAFEMTTGMISDARQAQISARGGGLIWEGCAND